MRTSRGRRHVERGVPVEEAERLEHEADVVTGITGQSSGRGTWWRPNVYQTTMSLSSIGRSLRDPRREAVAARVLVRDTRRLHSARRGRTRVTQRCLSAKPARRSSAESGLANGRTFSPGTSR